MSSRSTDQHRTRLHPKDSRCRWRIGQAPQTPQQVLYPCSFPVKNTWRFVRWFDVFHRPPGQTHCLSNVVLVEIRTMDANLCK